MVRLPRRCGIIEIALVLFIAGRVVSESERPRLENSLNEQESAPPRVIFMRASWLEKWLVLLVLFLIFEIFVTALLAHADILGTRRRNAQGRAVVCQGQLTDGKLYVDLPAPCRDPEVLQYYNRNAKPSSATSEGTKFGVIGVCRLLARLDPPAPAKCADFVGP